ncbi:MAG: universal stress protein [Leptothrix sp. (in: Bacteria)]|nr:universal stress protein [Leptothrix sp. (in: b-proteobacteria)]
MFKHLLVPVDGSELSVRAMTSSIELAQKLGARITGFVAEPDLPMSTISTNPSVFTEQVKSHEAKSEAHAQAVLHKFQTLCGEAGIVFSADHTTTQQVDRAIVEAAERAGADLVVMVTHGRGVFGELLFGSHTKNVMTRSKLPLLVLH